MCQHAEVAACVTECPALSVIVSFMGVYTTEWEHSVDCPSPKRHTQQIVSATEECYRHEDCPAGRFGVRAELHAAADLRRAHTLVQTRRHGITFASLPHQHLATRIITCMHPRYMHVMRLICPATVAVSKFRFMGGLWTSQSVVLLTSCMCTHRTHADAYTCTVPLTYNAVCHAFPNASLTDP